MFRRQSGGISVEIGEREAGLLRDLIGDYVATLDSENSAEPVMKRLFPDASLDDEQIAAAYRDLAHDSLADHKRATAQTALETLGVKGEWKAVLTEAERDAWMVLLTDLRLVLGTRLGVDEEMMGAEPDENDPAQWPLALIHYLGWLQDSLVTASEP